MVFCLFTTPRSLWIWKQWINSPYRFLHSFVQSMLCQEDWIGLLFSVSLHASQLILIFSTVTRLTFWSLSPINEIMLNTAHPIQTMKEFLVGEENIHVKGIRWQQTFVFASVYPLKYDGYYTYLFQHYKSLHFFHWLYLSVTYFQTK